jgi:hypothetical protein
LGATLEEGGCARHRSFAKAVLRARQAFHRRSAIKTG